MPDTTKLCVPGCCGVSFVVVGAGAGVAILQLEVISFVFQVFANDLITLFVCYLVVFFNCSQRWTFVIKEFQKFSFPWVSTDYLQLNSKKKITRKRIVLTSKRWRLVLK